MIIASQQFEHIELWACNKCKGVPTLGHLPNLRRVKIKGMENLTCMGSEFYVDFSKETRALFPVLKTLHIEDARNLIEWREAPAEVASVVFPCLEELFLTDCNQLRSAPSHFPSLMKLEVDEMDSGTPITSFLSKRLTTLTSLKIWRVKELVCLPEGMLENNKNLAYLGIWNCLEFSCIAPQSKGFEYSCASVQSIKISSCPNLRYLPDGLLTPSLKELILYDCESLESIPDITLTGLTSLETLEIEKCSKITFIPITQGLPSLRKLKIERCPELSSLPSGLEDCISVRSLAITECPKVTSISIDSLTTSLQELSVSNLESLPTLRAFTSLRHLTIMWCYSPQIGPQLCAALRRLVSLQELTVRYCSYLDIIPSLDNLTSLRKLEIGGFMGESSFPAFEVIPQIQRFPSLKRLDISYFYGLAIPQWLGNLATLKELLIQLCENVMYLPSVEAMQRLTKLEQLYIYRCPLLEETCTEESGPRFVMFHSWRLVALLSKIDSKLLEVPH